jgi:hypothetical protein
MLHPALASRLKRQISPAQNHQQYLLPRLLLPIQVIDFFLRQKWELDQKDNPSMEDLTGVCHALTTARALLLGGLNR